MRRRFIAEDDLPGVVALLAVSFPERNLEAWRLGLERLGRHEPPAGLPRYGVLLEAEGRIVGALLTICAEVGERRERRCHLSSWCTEPAFGAHAPLLPGPLLRHPDVTLVNVSPAAHTEATLAAQGFRLLCRGSLLVLPALARVRRGGRRLSREGAAGLAEGDLLATHSAWGCPCLAVEDGGDILPFVFSRPERLRGALPVSRLLYSRDLDRFARHAGALAVPLLRAGIAGVLIDTPSPVPGLHGWRVGGTQGRYWRGPRPPRLGDLAFSEIALFPDRARPRSPRRVP